VTLLINTNENIFDSGINGNDHTLDDLLNKIQGNKSVKKIPDVIQKNP
jgi:hypothetical protein